MLILILAIMLTVYILSVIGAWHMIRWLHLNKYKWTNPDGSDLAMTFMPGVNTVFAISFCFKKLFPKIDVNKFYKIDKRD